MVVMCGQRWIENSIASSLVRVNLLALMLMGNLRIVTPTAELEVVSYLPPLHLFIESEVIMQFRRIQGHLRLQDSALKTTTLRKRGHRFICRGFLSKLGVEEQETDKIPTTLVWNRRFSVISDSFAKRKLWLLIEIFTRTGLLAAEMPGLQS